jgi:GLPGLI family protein
MVRKNSSPLLFILGFVLPYVANGQISGIVTYNYQQRNLGISENYELKFNELGSVYIKNQIQREFKTPEGYTVILGKDFYKWYLTKGNSEVIEQQELPNGKLGYAKYNPKPISWEILDETKTVLSYTVQKAIAKNHHWRSASMMDTKEAIAWFAKDLPVSNGPDRFWGLPGLILELQFLDSNHLFRATKITLTSVDNIIPNQGAEFSKGKLYEMLKPEKNWIDKLEDFFTTKN